MSEPKEQNVYRLDMTPRQALTLRMALRVALSAMAARENEGFVVDALMAAEAFNLLMTFPADIHKTPELMRKLDLLCGAKTKASVMMQAGASAKDALRMEQEA